jgi:SAM-dependent methyltransferase
LKDLTCGRCSLEFPLVEEIPVLINNENSLFKVENFLEKRDTTYKTAPSWKRKLKRFIPSISLNLTSQKNLEIFFSQLTGENPKVLIIGGAVAGSGLEFDKFADRITFVESDVALGGRTNLICDAHDLPFRNETFDGIIIQFVLEHILEPGACVSEIYRVLKKDGVVYSDTPFMQQVHAGRYDFMRFSHLGHRRLFRNFSEIKSGPSCGAGMVLAWSYCYFLQSFFTSQTLGQIAWAFGSWTGFWLKYFDYFLLEKPTAFDAASSYFFIGRKSETVLSDKDLVAGYRGMIY